MGKKYVTLSFDDGIQQDKKVISVLKEYGLTGCTFNLNFGLAGEKRCIGRIGDVGFMEKQGELFRDGCFIKYTSHSRIPADEIRQVYEGFEIAAHGMYHRTAVGLTETELQEELLQDMQALSQLAGTPVTGVAFAGGMYNKRVVDFLRKNKVVYARGVQKTGSFRFPADPLLWKPTCSILSKELFSIVDRFIQADVEEDILLYVWGHAYEFDYGSRLGNWDRLRTFCERITEHPELISLTNGEIIARCNAAQRQKCPGSPR